MPEISHAEQKRRAAAASTLHGAAAVLEIYGIEPSMTKKLRRVGDDIYAGRLTRKSR